MGRPRKDTITYGKILKGIPVPKICTYRSELMKMESGDAIALKTFKEADNMRTAARYLDKRCLMRRIPDGKGYYVWVIDENQASTRGN